MTTPKYNDPLPARLVGMTADKWDALCLADKIALRDNSHLSPLLLDLVGCRVEAVRLDGSKQRFVVGRSTGWRPCHIELDTRTARSGDPADFIYASVKFLERVR